MRVSSSHHQSHAAAGLPWSRMCERCGADLTTVSGVTPDGREPCLSLALPGTLSFWRDGSCGGALVAQVIVHTFGSRDGFSDSSTALRSQVTHAKYVTCSPYAGACHAQWTPR